MLINFIYILIVLILIFVTIIAVRAIKKSLDIRKNLSEESSAHEIEESSADEIKEKNLVENINKLNDLYSKGILNKDEFEKAKKKILD